MGYVLFSGCVTGIAGDQFRGNSPVSGPDGGKEHELHSFMVVRHGKCAAKGWWKPYAPELAHPLYSFGKTLTATAIGFARQEKILSLEERLVDLFPELLPKEPSENLQKVTLWHLLTMSCGHETEIEHGIPRLDSGVFTASVFT